MPWVVRDRIEVEVPVEATEPDGTAVSFRARVAIGTALFRAIREGGTAAEEAVRTSVVGWADVLDAEGRPVPYSREWRDRMWELPWIARPLAEAVVRAAVDQRGNASAPSAGSS